MRTKCQTCLCRTCLKTCCDRKNCTEKKEDCKNYSGFRQLSIFDPPPQPQYQSAPRHSWQYYGISKDRYRRLTEYIQSDIYASVARQAAHTACEDFAEYFLLSVRKNLSYEGLEKLWARGDIERMPCGRSDFYGWRRYFFSIMNEKMKEIGK